MSLSHSATHTAAATHAVQCRVQQWQRRAHNNGQRHSASRLLVSSPWTAQRPGKQIHARSPSPRPAGWKEEQSSPSAFGKQSPRSSHNRSTVGSKQQLLIKYLRRRPPLEHAVSKMFDCSPLQLLWGCAVWISDALRCSPGALHACRAHQRVDTEAGDCPWPVLHGRAPHHQPGCSISTSSVIDNSRGTACAYHPHV